MLGCQGDTEPTDMGDTATPDELFCADAPLPTTWDNFGRSFVTQHCQPCHASTSLDRQYAPAEVTFDTEEQSWAWADRILARAAADDATMPPQGGVEEDDRYLLEVWLTCGG